MFLYYLSSQRSEGLLQSVFISSFLPIPSKSNFHFYIAEAGSVDIIDETLDLFRANSLFRNFEIKGPADRLLIILILFVSDCLAKVTASRTPPTQIEATKTLNTLAVDNFPLPGDANFPLNAHYTAPSNRIESGAYGNPSFQDTALAGFTMD
jgi:actin related protein 2/3 complex subunit 3